MIIIPAIDLLDEKVVRLLQGDYTKAKIYSDNPLEVARKWKEKGARRLHIVDLNGARDGKPTHLKLVSDIVKSVGIDIEFGGGIRSMDLIKEAIATGCSYVTMCTKLCEDLEFVKKANNIFGEKIIVSIDSRNGFVAVQGWQMTTGIKAIDIVKDIDKIGIKTIIYTDILKDGAMQGPDIEGVKQILKNTSLSVIISGGITTISDIQNIYSLKNSRVFGCIIGKALYEGSITMEQIKTMAKEE